MDQPAPGAAPAPGLSPWQRGLAVFTRPRAAFAGKGGRPTFLFPMVIFLLAALGQTLLIYQPAVVPMQVEQLEKRVEQGRMAPEALDRAEELMRSPSMMALGAVGAVVVLTLINLLTAGLILLAVNFVLAGAMTFRQAWALTWWSSLVSVVGLVVSTSITLGLGRFPVHLGLGILAPAEQATSKLGAFVGSALDGINPFSIWWVMVLAIGASAMTGKPSRALAWTFAGFYLGAVLLGAGLGALGAPVGG